MHTRAQLIRNALLLVVALVFVNLISERAHFRLDLTSDKRYSLSGSTLNLLRDLPETVTVTAWFTEKMPPDLAIARQDFKDLLVEYAARSKGQVVFEFIDPSSADSMEKRALDEGMRQLIATTREKDKAENLKVYMGATVRMGDRRTAIPVIQQGSALEWALSSAIKEVSIIEKPIVGIIQGHGEPPIEAMPQLVQNLNVMYSVQPMAIYDSLPINDRFTALMLIDPQDTIPPMQLDRLHDFLAKGRGVVVLYSAVNSALGSSPVIDMRHIGLEPWLERHGLRIDQRIVVDQRCNQVQVMQQMGNFTLPVPVPVTFPYFPVISSFSDHPVCSGLDVVTYQFCSPILSTGDTTLQFSPLLYTSDKSGLLPAPQMIDINRQWSEAEFTSGAQVVGAEVKGRFGNGSEAHLMLFTNGGLCVNGLAQGQQPQQLPEGNINLMVNAVDRATGSNDLLGLRGKEVEYRPIEEVSDVRRSALKWMNLLLPVIILLTYGILRRAWRRRQRKLRMAPDHVR
jgi:gliding-associated putative ABC transporter substrate-binding component GldG